MRDYSKVGPKFWIGATGKLLRAEGMEAQIVAMYLLTSPHANMLGLYYCPTMFIAHETGLGLEGATKGLRSAIEAGFCEYDEASEVVWVIEMAAYQIADSLKPNDLRVKGVHNEYMSLPSNPYLVRFYEKYKDAFCMAECRENSRPLQAPSKPLPSQEQEQEQEQEHKQERAASSQEERAAPEHDGESPPPPRQESSKSIPDEAPNRAAQLAVLLRRNGADARTHAASKGVAELTELKATDAQVLIALETAKQRRQDAGSAQPVTAAYLVPIVQDLQNPQPPGAKGRYAEDIRQMREMSAWADEQIRQQSERHPPTEIDMGAIDAASQK